MKFYIHFDKEIDSYELLKRGAFPRSKRAALEASIRKWKALVQANKRGKYVEENGGATCALCKLYYNLDDRCAGCPIAELGHAYCLRTPWEKYVNTVNPTVALKHAQAEVKFLESLRSK